MIIKASGRSALILATGLWVCFAGPSQAAADDAATSSTLSSTTAPLALHKYAKPGAHHLKKVAHRKSSKLAQKPSSTNKPAADDTADKTTPDDSVKSPSTASSTLLPASIANANAKMASADTPDSNARAMTARASNILQTASNNTTDTQAAGDSPADMQVVSADQLNDVDRALQENNQNGERQMPLAMASAEPPTTVASNDSNTLDKTSLIGKIFIGFGALLTLASAARMFMA